jgi:hypothetical protein
MNEFEFLSTSQLDRLVDDELGEHERRELLLALDRESDGWRRLALSFLESQVLRRALQKKDRVVSIPVVLPESVSMPSRRPHGVVALCACGLLMFGIGRWTALPSSDSNLAIHSSPQTYTPRVTSEHMAHNPTAPSVIPVSTSQPQQTMRVELEEGPGQPVQSVDVPVVERGDVAAEDLLDAPLRVSDAVQRALRQAGQRVYEKRQLFEVQFADGRRGLIPVSDVLVENSGWDAFQ